MEIPAQIERLLDDTDTKKVQTQNVWTQDNIVNSPYNDVEIPNIALPEYIWRNVEKWLDKTAVVCGTTNRSFTYHQLSEYSRNLAATLRANFQIKNGEVIGLIIPNALEYPIAVLGVLQAGAVVTTMNPMFTATEIIKVVQEAIHMKKTDITIITVETPNEDLPPGTISFEVIIKNNEEDKNVLKYVRIKPNDVVMLLYSSGTTGLPKGVELTNRNVVATFAQLDFEGVNYCYETTSIHQDSVMAVLPLYHMYGLLLVLLRNLMFGAKLVVLPAFQPTIFFNALKNHNINLLYAVPPIVLFLNTHSEVSKEHLVSIDRLICGAAPIAISDIRKLLDKCQPGLRFIHAYGLTEATQVTISMLSGSNVHTSVGFAIPNIQLRVVDSNGCNLGPGKVGELYIRGPQVMKGYRDNPEATKATITDDGWLRSGDLVTINNEGIITIVGRIKEIIKVKGYQVSPAELEHLLKEHPDILDAAVVGIPDDKKGEVPKAFIVLKEGHKSTATNIKEFVNRNVVEYKRIKEVEFLDALPKNSTGKILRQVLKNN